MTLIITCLLIYHLGLPSWSYLIATAVWVYFAYDRKDQRGRAIALIRDSILKLETKSTADIHRLYEVTSTRIEKTEELIKALEERLKTPEEREMEHKQEMAKIREYLRTNPKRDETQKTGETSPTPKPTDGSSP